MEWNAQRRNRIKEDYDNCTKVISAFYGGEVFSVMFPTDANGPSYFISTVDSDCENGQKLAINVVSSASSITAGALSVLVLVLSSIMAMLMN